MWELQVYELKTIANPNPVNEKGERADMISDRQAGRPTDRQTKSVSGVENNV